MQHIFRRSTFLSASIRNSPRCLPPPHIQNRVFIPRRCVAFDSQPSDRESSGTTTPTESATSNESAVNCPFHLVTGYALYAKRPSRPFPPPFLSHPSSSFSDPLSTHNRSVDKRKEQRYKGEIIRGITNGDDAVLVSERFVAAGDGVGAWAQKERGHAA